MPLFFSISGFCFCLSQNKSLNRKMILNKVKRLIIPYFTIAFLYMDPIKILLDVPGYKFSLNLLMQQFILFQNNDIYGICQHYFSCLSFLQNINMGGKLRDYSCYLSSFIQSQIMYLITFRLSSSVNIIYFLCQDIFAVFIKQYCVKLTFNRL